MPNEPAGIAEHRTKYRAQAWKEYSYEELQNWVLLFVKRAGHRVDIPKRIKDLEDARNYLEMLIFQTKKSR